MRETLWSRLIERAANRGARAVRINHGAMALCAMAAMVACCVLITESSAAENWIDIGGSNYSKSLAVDRNSVGRVEGFPSSVGAWVRYTYAMSIDCSPPRGCLAASQLVYTLVNCPGQAIASVQAISLDHNGNVVAQSVVNFNAVQYIVHPRSPEAELWRMLCPGYPDRFDRP